MTEQPQKASQRSQSLGGALGVLLVVVLEFGILTAVYHSDDGVDARHESWTALRATERAWGEGQSTSPVENAFNDFELIAGQRAQELDPTIKAWVAAPSAETFVQLRRTTNVLGEELNTEQTKADIRAMIIFSVLLAVASIGWFVWFRRVIRQQRDLQSSLTEANVLMAGEQRLTTLVRNSSDLVMVIEPDTSISFASPSTHGVLGLTPGEVLGQRVGDLVAPQDAPLLASLLAAGDGDGSDVPVLLRANHADGREIILEGTLTDLLSEQTVNGWLLTVRDVTERIALQDQLAHQALHDPLTGLANRQLFTERLSHALRVRSGAMNPVVVMFMDLDDFKVVNDSQGHGAGDEILVQFAEWVSENIRQGDTAARLGGDEFAVLMEDSDVESAQIIAERLVRAMSAPITVQGVDLTVHASMGLALGTPGESTTGEVLRNADVAMYFAKDRGKDRVAVYDPELHATALGRLKVRSELATALERGELALHYQPAYLLDSGQVDGFEALIRWNHPVHGLLFPDSFIDVAEQSGQIIAIGRWVLFEACRAAALELTVGDARPVIAVNVSARQLVEAGFFDEVLTALQQSGLDPGRLVLEITETVLLNDRPAMIESINGLRRLGIHIAIDDFGTGYSSLSYLADLPVDILKIDKSFVDGIGRGGESLVEAIIQLSSSLGLVTLAEGVEQTHQADWLLAAGCDIGQGWLWNKALPLDEAAATLASSQLVPQSVGVWASATAHR